MLFFFRFLNSIDVIELGGFDELCGKGYELCLFLFSDVLEISKKKSASKGLGLRSPSTMSLRTMGASTLTNNGKSITLSKTHCDWKKNRASDNEGKFHSFLMCRI